MNFPAPYVILGIGKAPTPKVDALSQGILSLRTTPILCCRQDRHFYFFLFLLSRKARNATIKLPKDINKPIIPMNIIIISAAVISRTSLPMYSWQARFWLGRLPPCHGYFPMQFSCIMSEYHLFLSFSTHIFLPPPFKLCDVAYLSRIT